MSERRKDRKDRVSSSDPDAAATKTEILPMLSLLHSQYAGRSAWVRNVDED